MKRILTIFLFAVCVMITMLIVKIDDYEKLYSSSQNPNLDIVNNKLENLTSEEIDEVLELLNKNENEENVEDKNDNDNDNDNNITTTSNLILNKFRERLDQRFTDIDKQIMIKHKSSSFLPWYNVIYDTRDMSYKLKDNSDVVEWIEIDNKEEVFGAKLTNFNDIKNFLGNDSIIIDKVENVDLNYEYYELTYNYDDINIKFMSYYEDGTNNICIVS